jgi:four helix bundle protein
MPQAMLAWRRWLWNKLSAVSFQLSAISVQPLATKDFRELKVWQKAHRSSIPANLAEGCGRGGDADFGRFCSIAMGSASEPEYDLLLAKDLKLITPKHYEELAQRTVEVKRMLSALVQKLKADRWWLTAFYVICQSS